MSVSNGLTDAWVLHSRPYRNTSLIVELFSASHGWVSAVARGGRRNRLLQPFTPLQVSLGGRHELRTLRSSESSGSALQLAGEALYCGLYLNELLMRLLHRDDPHADIMAAYRQALYQLEENALPRDLVLRVFELGLLHELGYGFALDQDVHGAAVSPAGRYALLPEQGLVQDIRGNYSGDQLLAMSAGDWDEQVRRAARDLMREALAPHLGNKPLASRALFRHGVRDTTATARRAGDDSNNDPNKRTGENT